MNIPEKDFFATYILFLLALAAGWISGFFMFIVNINTPLGM